MHVSVAPVVKITLDKERHLLYDFAALEVIEEKLNQPIFEKGFLSVVKSAKNMPIILWGGLLHEDKELTTDKVRELIRGKDPGPIMDAVLKAWGLSQPEKDEDEESADPTNPEANQQVGSPSGVVQDTTSA